MQQRVFTIAENAPVARETYRLRLAGDTAAITAPGQFVDIRLAGRFLRRPVSVCCWSDGALTLYYKVAGAGTAQLSTLAPGTELVTGTNIIVKEEQKSAFRFEKGPIFANLVLADEINRATPKTQSALLEAMQEHTVTIGTTSHQLPEPFLVLATQNPIENEGTYPLPEAQLDRFLFKVLVKFPDRQELRGIVELTEGNHPPKIEKVMDRESLLAARACVAQIPIADAVMDYILDLVMATHADNPYIREGASPRAAQALIRTARARAFMENRLNVSFEDVKCVALPVLRHRILLSFDAVSEGITEDAVIGQILTEKEQGLYA